MGLRRLHQVYIPESLLIQGKHFPCSVSSLSPWQLIVTPSTTVTAHSRQGPRAGCFSPCGHLWPLENHSSILGPNRLLIQGFSSHRSSSSFLSLQNPAGLGPHLRVVSLKHPFSWSKRRGTTSNWEEGDCGSTPTTASKELSVQFLILADRNLLFTLKLCKVPRDAKVAFANLFLKS